MSRNQLRKLHARRTRWMLRAQRRDRRGVLLMVVLSMLALFLLLGTAFLVSSRFYATTGKEAGKLNRTTNNPADLMERAMLQVLRDTNNPSSSIRYHSLLRDVYGSDGFIAEVMVPDNARRDLMAQYSGASLPSAGSLTTPPLLGHTQGQFIDLYVVDPLALPGELPDSQHVIKLERSPSGFTVDHDLETAKNYHAGCILTMLAGPAAGQSTRIISSQVVDYVQQPTPNGNSPRPVVRLRVMAFPASNGEAMTPGKSPVAARDVELVDIAGYAFMVNGRANSGTGAGLNRLAQRGAAKLSTVEVQLDQGGNPLDMHEVALTPNYRFFPSGLSQYHPTTGVSMIGSNHPTAGFQPFGNFGQGQNLYITADGPGGSNESYDAVDYQNMFLAHMPVSPVAQAGVLIDNSGVPLRLDIAAVQAGATGLRLDMENTIIPSFHRPSLQNYWNHRMLGAAWMGSLDPTQRMAIITQPYGADGASRPTDATQAAIADTVVNIKRKVSLRPIREDHPNFDGSNSQTGLVGTVPTTTNFYTWEVVGPWDVDNDNDGINDSVWVDLGDPVQETENGTLYKPLYAFLIVDLDNRLNVNAHGSPDHFAVTPLDPMLAATGNVGNLAGTATSNLLPQGMGYGPGDISLGSILSPLTQPYSPAYVSQFGDPRSLPSDPINNDYASLFAGRRAADPRSNTIWGRMGNTVTSPLITPGRPFDATNATTMVATREAAIPFDFVGYPVTDTQRAQRLYLGTNDPNWAFFASPSAFATVPDLRGRFAVGVDYMGQPVQESLREGVTLGTSLDHFTAGTFIPVIDDSPYETDLSANSRRGLPAAVVPNDDALFATSELERLLRRYDPETGTAPSRLLDIVSAFDPLKYASTTASDPSNITPNEMAYAQTVTGINSRQVTTDSYEIPTPSDVVPSYITELGPDGAPGRANVDDDDQFGEDDAGEIGWHQEQNENDPTEGLYLLDHSDDFEAYTGKSVAEARFVDVVWYRIQRAREKRGLPIYNWHNPQAVAIMNNICDQLLPPEVLAGYKMDINRPFGDGADNNGNGIVDEPEEAGDPYFDANGNGVWDAGEPFVNLNGNTLPNGDAIYDPPLDRLWAAQLGGMGAMLDATMGVDVTGRGSYIDANGNGVRDPGEGSIQPGQPTLRDDAHLARQLYARHLYMLMLVLMDEDYLAPYDPADPSVRGYLRVKALLLKNNSNPPLNPYQAKVEAQRRYTCRQIAQWAINCVDFRDSDSINTPFEYDEYPWDGWGTVDDGGNPTDPTNHIHYPLDGDPATDENHKQVVDWGSMGVDGVKVVTNAIPEVGANGNQIRDDNATRGLVWGAERPELLISETLAMHDMRQEDLVTGADEGDNTTSPSQDPNRPTDDDLDQRLEPRGSLYVEVYNPNSGDAPKPVELYRHGSWDRNGDGRIDDLDRFHYADLNGDGAFDPDDDQIVEGVLLDRLSDRGQVLPNGEVRRSPVWRIIVVEEHPGYHPYEGGNDIPFVTRDDATSHVGDLSATDPSDAISPSPLIDYRNAYEGVGRISERPWQAPMNMDWDEMYFIPPWTTADFTDVQMPWRMSSWQQRRTSEERVNALNPKNEQADFQRQLFSKPYPYIEREFYFTSGNTPYFGHVRSLQTGQAETSISGSQRSYTDLDTTELATYHGNLRLRVPFNYIELGQTTGTPELVSMPHRFVANRHADPQTPNRNLDVRIAPIMPGRYGVIGDAGSVYIEQRLRQTRNETPPRTRFITTFGRNVDPSEPDSELQTKDEYHNGMVLGTRRIELQPSGNPFLQQVLVGANGGVTSGAVDNRAGELMRLPALASQNQQAQSEVINMTAQTGAQGISAGSQVFAPVVAIPVDDMNVSEPAYGYGVRAREVFEQQGDKGDQDHTWKPDAANGEGSFVNTGGTLVHFDTPFDVDPEFQGAERSPKFLPKYRVVHLQRLADPTTPWNPPLGYMEADPRKKRYAQHDPRLPVNPYLTVDSAAVDLTVFNGTSSSQAQAAQYTNFFSRERSSQLQRTAGSPAGFPQRWTLNQDTFLSLQAAGVPNESRRITTRDRIFPEQVRTDHGIAVNHFDFYFGHSLGFPNESLGPVYLRPETGLDPATGAIDPTDLIDNESPTSPQQARTMGPALGAPRPDGNLTSTAPWMTWNNRPFVSESELLQVPGWSSMELLRKFTGHSTETSGPYLNARRWAITPNNQPVRAWEVDVDMTDNGTQDLVYDQELTNAERYRQCNSGFGSLFNLLQSSRYPSRILRDNNGNPVAIGAGGFHRILDYVHTPSRFVATDTLLNPVAFSAAGVTSPDDPRSGKAAPFNRVPDYREPGKVNLNTVVSQRGASPTSPTTPNGITVWSDVFDGLMHRVRDFDPLDYPNGAGLGHTGPAWRDVVLSRRGYADPVFHQSASLTPTHVDRVDLVLNNESPTFFGNPFRSSAASDLVPLSGMIQLGAEASMMRSHPFQPVNYPQRGNLPGWGNAGTGVLTGNTRMAGLADGNVFQQFEEKEDRRPSVPLFSELTFVPGIDAPRNSAMHYMPLTRIDNLTTTRSGVFAVWVTVGYFEVLPAPAWEATSPENADEAARTRQKFQNQTGDTADPPLRARALYDKVYPQGYQLGKELKSETGDVDRHRSFYIIDRTRPVAFKPGEDVNVEDAILLRRRID